ncbi:hypothetical protein NQ318_021408 [Aromia moschata]|uniref:Transposase n=1 Tax=Aromia moschata TaxID=1265417 RepID=A0AAV8ZE44_9CUCU|nr:hypothetical protein NQ318_021408 [Aromia moschata]
MSAYTVEEKRQIIKWYYADNSPQEIIGNLAEVNFPCNSNQISDELDIQPRTVRKILKRNKFKCYKLQTTQEIFPEDQTRRMEFCEEMMEKANGNGRFIEQILFTDESSFSLHGHHNPSVAVGYSRENKHLSIPQRTQYPQKKFDINRMVVPPIMR